MDIPEEAFYKDIKKETAAKKHTEILSKDISPIIYQRNKPSDEFYLIL